MIDVGHCIADPVSSPYYTLCLFINPSVMLTDIACFLHVKFCLLSITAVAFEKKKQHLKIVKV